MITQTASQCCVMSSPSGEGLKFVQDIITPPAQLSIKPELTSSPSLSASTQQLQSNMKTLHLGKLLSWPVFKLRSTVNPSQIPKINKKTAERNAQPHITPGSTWIPDDLALNFGPVGLTLICHIPVYKSPPPTQGGLLPNLSVIIIR